MELADSRALMSLRVLLADDHRLFTAGLSLRLQERGHRVIVTEGPAAALIALRADPVDVCVFDVAFPHDDGIRATAEAIALRPHLPIMVLTALADAPTARAAAEAGARSIVSKSRPLEVIVEAVEQVAAGVVLVEPALLRPAAEPGRYGALTSREREALSLLAQGCSTRALAERMQISYHTARQYVQRILTVTGAHTRTEAVALALRAGLVPGGPSRDAVL